MLLLLSLFIFFVKGYNIQYKSTIRLILQLSRPIRSQVLSMFAKRVSINDVRNTRFSTPSPPPGPQPSLFRLLPPHCGWLEV